MADTALVQSEYAKYSNMGLKNISADDIKPPLLFMVQGIKDKSELVDATGRECPEGHFFLKGVNEIYKEIEVYVVWIKRDHFVLKPDDDRTNPAWDGTPLYRTIMVKADDLSPLAFTFQKSSLNGLQNLLTAKISKNLPIFVFKCVLKTILTTSKDGKNDYYKSVVGVKSIETDKEVLDKVFSLAQGFDLKEQVITQEDGTDEEVEAAEVEETVEDTSVPDQANSTIAQDVADDVPF